jgi:hypothetical protein
MKKVMPSGWWAQPVTTVKPASQCTAALKHECLTAYNNNPANTFACGNPNSPYYGVLAMQHTAQVAGANVDCSPCQWEHTSCGNL